MSSITFAQFKIPIGFYRHVPIACDDDLDEHVAHIKAEGYSFEIEGLSTGEWSLEVCNSDGAIASTIEPHDIDGPTATRRLIAEATSSLAKMGGTA